MWKPKVEHRDPETLIPYAKNAKVHSREQINKVASAISSFGFTQPIVVDKDGVIIAGHCRREAAIALHLKEVPVVVASHLDEYQAMAARIADNRVAESPWDTEMLKFDLGTLELKEFDLKLTGFDIPQIESFLKDGEISPEMFGGDRIASQSAETEPAPVKTIEPVKGNIDDDEVPEEVTPRTKLGNIYKLGNHRLMCGDSSHLNDVEDLMNGEKADMVFTDPPYGVSYEKKTQEIANQSKTRHKSTITNDDLSVDDLKTILLAAFSNIDSVLADKSCYYVCSPQGGELGLMMMMMMQESNLICRHMIIWVKNAPVFSMNRLDYDYKHEPILFGWSKNRTHHKLMEGDFKNSVWEVSREQNKVHPTMKPLALPENAIKNSCPHGGNVIDLFGGSGSTLIACEKTNRKCFTMELDPHYCDVIITRWEQFTGKKAELID